MFVYMWLLVHMRHCASSNNLNKEMFSTYFVVRVGSVKVLIFQFGQNTIMAKKSYVVSSNEVVFF